MWSKRGQWPTEYAREIASGTRFEFGKNWRAFLDKLSSEQVGWAQRSLEDYLGRGNLLGKSFLDIGSGSGLFSLAARRLGARVSSFDFDPESVACTSHVKGHFFPGDEDWTIHEGSILDDPFVRSLGVFDVVYAWGVLHHTGALWKALENAASLVGPSGTLYVAVYNDQGRATRLWRMVKRAHNKLPRVLRWLVVIPAFGRMWGPRLITDLFSLTPLRSWRQYGRTGRGMSPWRDVLDWVGGYPFEVAKPEEVFHFLLGRGFTLRKLKTCAGGIGCNEFVFSRAL